MHITPFKSLALIVALGAARPSGARAQAASTADSSRAAAEAAADTARRNLVLANPLGVVFNLYNGEYEHVISKSASIGFAGTYYAPTDYTYFTSEIKMRYYPSERAPDGFSLALSAGLTHETGSLLCFDSCDSAPSNRPTLGSELDYNWLLGPTRRFAIGTGIGAKRFFGSKTYGSIDWLPTARLA
ncbi:MAG TPA: hypothetical protein VII66_00105, partial [Gemmatimonadaceae bacterium]